MKSKLQNQLGLSLMEVVICLAMIALFLVLYQTAANATVLNKNSKYQDLALRIANTKIDSLRTTSYNSLPASGSFADPLLTSLPSGQATLTNTAYNTKTKQIVVRVSWLTQGNSTAHSVSLTTLITQGGLGQ